MCSSDRAHPKTKSLDSAAQGLLVSSQAPRRTSCETVWATMQERGAFTLVLSGGSLLKAVGQLVGAPGVDFSKWHVFFVDERNVPHSHPDSNFKGADEALLSKVC